MLAASPVVVAEGLFATERLKLAYWTANRRRIGGRVAEGLFATERLKLAIQYSRYSFAKRGRRAFRD